jgi:hypothetical protein
VHVEVGQQRSTGTPGVVHGDQRNARLAAPGGERAVEVARVDRRAERRGEHEPGRLPRDAGRVTSGFLLDTAQLQSGGADRWQREAGV